MLWPYGFVLGNVKVCFAFFFFFRVLRLRPDPATLLQNKLLLEATYLHDDSELAEDDDELLDGSPLTFRRRQEAAEFLLTMSSGSWREDRIVHHCRLGCCKSARESKLKIWCAIQAPLQSQKGLGYAT